MKRRGHDLNGEPFRFAFPSQKAHISSAVSQLKTPIFRVWFCFAGLLP